jgi:hypothetical protein
MDQMSVEGLKGTAEEDKWFEVIIHYSAFDTLLIKIAQTIFIYFILIIFCCLKTRAKRTLK